MKLTSKNHQVYSYGDGLWRACVLRDERWYEIDPVTTPEAARKALNKLVKEISK